MFDINYLAARQLGQMRGYQDFSILEGIRFEELRGGIYNYIITEKGDIFRIEEGDMLRRIKPHKSRGYWYFNAVVKKGHYRQLLVHRAVAMLFVPNPENKPEVNHKNKNTDDNCADNLEWVTKSENERHKWKTMSEEEKEKIKTKMRKSKNITFSNKWRSVICIETQKSYKTVTAAANDIGVHKNTIVAACQRNSLVRKKYHFKYL